MTYDVVVVGASVAGLAATEELRRGGFAGTIALVDAERHLPYDKPPLSKKLLRPAWDPAHARLRPREHYDALEVDLLLGVAARALDASSREVTLATGRVLCGHDIVLATGASPRPPPGRPMAGVHTLRGLDEAVAIRRELTPGSRLVVVGGGFVGAEVAAAARQHGVDVTLVEAMPVPFLGLLGADVGRALAEVHGRRGVRLECGVAVAGIEHRSSLDDTVEVVLADGRRLAADVVVVGLGVRPNTEWLTRSGLELGDGVVCDDEGRTSVDHVYAAGDMAAWFDAGERVHLRSQHWTTAREQGSAVARALAGRSEGAVRSAVPYFWSDQFDLRLQAYGRTLGHDASELVWGSYVEERFVALYHRAGTLIGAVGVNAARELRRYHGEIEEATTRSWAGLDGDYRGATLSR